MKTSMVKSWFLCLAYQMQVGGGTDCSHLEAVETELRCLREELEVSRKTQVELHEGLVNAIGRVDSAQERLV